MPQLIRCCSYGYELEILNFGENDHHREQVMRRENSFWASGGDVHLLQFRREMLMLPVVAGAHHERQVHATLIWDCYLQAYSCAPEGTALQCLVDPLQVPSSGLGTQVAMSHEIVEIAKAGLLPAIARPVVWAEVTNAAVKRSDAGPG